MRNYIGLKAEGMGFDAHLTVLYTGNLDNDRANAVDQIIKDTGPQSFWVSRYRIDLFGPDKDIPVLLVDYPIKLSYLRDHFLDLGVPCPSEYSWVPHITLVDFRSEKTIKIPKHIRLVNLGLY